MRLVLNTCREIVQAPEAVCDYLDDLEQSEGLITPARVW